jgi:hypothetical protein
MVSSLSRLSCSHMDEVALSSAPPTPGHPHDVHGAAWVLSHTSASVPVFVERERRFAQQGMRCQAKSAAICCDVRERHRRGNQLRGNQLWGNQLDRP